MTGPRLSIRTPSRLHFGLLGWGPGTRRQFGGLGLMIESPSVELTAEPAAAWHVVGPLADRVERILELLRDRLPAAGIPTRPASLRVLQAAPEHAGLGVGTQISLAVATAVLRIAGWPVPSTVALARLTGRGARSGIGLHGFLHGGLIVDGGRKEDGGLPPLLARYHFPDDWSVLVVQPPGGDGLHGPDEMRAFAELPPIDERVTERLCRIVLLELLPAVVEHDLPAFGDALRRLQVHVGASFAPAQGGVYSSPRAAEIVAELQRAGFVGAGQSSWGPTLYAFSDRPRDEISALADVLCDSLSLDRSLAVVTAAANRGASVDEL